MNRCFAVLLMLLTAGCKSEPRACEKMRELCGTESAICRDLREDVQAQLGQPALDTLDGCVLQANSCSEAAGCVSGEAAKASVEAAANFVTAFAKSASPSSAEECVKNAKSEAEANGCRAGAVGKAMVERLNQFAAGLKKSQ
ncbi:MAG: hypothetical protein QM765_29235 [Myxococcales bacterium]